MSKMESFNNRLRAHSLILQGEGSGVCGGGLGSTYQLQVTISMSKMESFNNWLRAHSLILQGEGSGVCGGGLRGLN
ncbi:MAG: hypothetical protein R8P61_02795 [Bacteroidia bacterium]|nr:hypothetical protein [Bacteroidia bacterium]